MTQYTMYPLHSGRDKSLALDLADALLDVTLPDDCRLVITLTADQSMIALVAPTPSESFRNAAIACDEVVNRHIECLLQETLVGDPDRFADC